jgi:nitroreductase
MNSGGSLTVTDAMLSRFSCRAFLPQPVAEAVLRQLLQTASRAPSGGNLQPWVVHVLSGESLKRFRAMLAPKVAASPMGGKVEYDVYPPKLGEPYRSRRFQVGEDMYATIGIARDDRAGRLSQFARNYDFFGAPTGMFFLVDRQMGAPQWADLGMLLQSVMLLAREQGLETCAQESWERWHEEVTQFLGAPPELMLFCGMAIGYRDAGAPINTLRSRRAPLAEFSMFHG